MTGTPIPLPSAADNERTNTMSKRKPFSVHDLYPADYCFDYDAFKADPENYVFTPEDCAYLNAMELEEYELEVPMTPYEKRLLRNWVASGHSVHENAGSKYICLAGGSPPFDFLDVYRMDRKIRHDMKGMSEAEQEAYLKAYTGWHDDADPVPFFDEDDGADSSPIFDPFVQD